MFVVCPFSCFSLLRPLKEKPAVAGTVDVKAMVVQLTLLLRAPFDVFRCTCACVLFVLFSFRSWASGSRPVIPCPALRASVCFFWGGQDDGNCAWEKGGEVLRLVVSCLNLRLWFGWTGSGRQEAEASHGLGRFGSGGVWEEARIRDSVVLSCAFVAFGQAGQLERAEVLALFPCSVAFLDSCARKPRA